MLDYKYHLIFRISLCFYQRKLFFQRRKMSYTHTHIHTHIIHSSLLVPSSQKYTFYLYTSSEKENAVALKTSKEFTSIKSPVKSRHCLVTGFFILSKAD